MSTLSGRRSRLLVLVLAGLPALAAAGGRLPRLPADRDLPRSGDSPGTVTFSHASHVDESRPDCTSCHPRLFRMTRTAVAARPMRVTHAEMDAGRACGACHDGRDAHGRDDCASCHRPQ